MSELQHQVAVVTGGSRGIGRAVALRLGKAGAAVAVCARASDALDEVVALLASAGAQDVLAIPADLSSEEGPRLAIRQTVSALGPPTILVNNAASFRVGGFEGVTDLDWHHHLDLKLLGYMRTMREVLPHMRTSGYGRIVNIAGNAALVASPKAVLAGPINSAVANLTRSVALAEAASGITANVVHPGHTRTDRHTEKVRELAVSEGISMDDAQSRIARSVPIGRAIEPDEIAAVVCFLASRDASAVTGQAIAVDGGASSGMAS
jgi:NAD(P)-dependent dehydrogenase (short-subunit alcohol dehydrogenase family)